MVRRRVAAPSAAAKPAAAAVAELLHVLRRRLGHCTLEFAARIVRFACECDARKQASLDELHVRRVAAHGWQWEAAGQVRRPLAEQHEHQRVTFGLQELKHASCGRLGPLRPHHCRAILGNGRKENLGRCERLLRLAQPFRAGH